MWSLSVRHSQSHGEIKVNTEAFRKQSLTESKLPTSSIVMTCKTCPPWNNSACFYLETPLQTNDNK